MHFRQVISGGMTVEEEEVEEAEEEAPPSSSCFSISVGVTLLQAGYLLIS